MTYPFRFAHLEVCLYTNVEEGEPPKRVTIIRREANPSGACGNVDCCGPITDRYAIRYEDGSVDTHIDEYWLEKIP